MNTNKNLNLLFVQEKTILCYYIGVSVRTQILRPKPWRKETLGFYWHACKFTIM